MQPQPLSGLADVGGRGGSSGPFGATATPPLHCVASKTVAPAPLPLLSRGHHWAAITGTHFAQPGSLVA